MENNRHIALKLHDENMPIVEIAAITELTIDEINGLKNALEIILNNLFNF